MSTFHFTLIVDGPDLQDESRIGALFEAGCDDAAIGRNFTSRWVHRSVLSGGKVQVGIADARVHRQPRVIDPRTF